jgi:hypothetical protein
VWNPRNERLSNMRALGAGAGGLCSRDGGHGIQRDLLMRSNDGFIIRRTNNSRAATTVEIRAGAIRDETNIRRTVVLRNRNI